MTKTFSTLLLALTMAGFNVHAQDEEPGKKMESQQIIIQQKGNGNESLSIRIDGDDVTVNGKPLSEHDDKNVIIKKKKMIISDGDKIIYDSDREGVDDKKDEPAQKRAFLGVTTETAEKGARIMAVTKESAADKAGLQRGDVITKLNDRKIESPESLTQAVGQCQPGEQVKIKYIREGKEKTVKTELGERPEEKKSGSGNVRSFSFSMPDGQFKSFSFPGEEGADLEKFFRMPDISDLNMDFSAGRKPKLGLKLQDTEKGSGVKVLEVEENSPSSKAGLRKDDIIIEINENPVKNTDDAREELKESSAGDSYKIKILREGTEMTMDVYIPKRLKTIDL